MGLIDSPRCIYCPTKLDDAQHTFHCDRWTEERRAATDAIGEALHPENLVPHMIGSKPKWEAIMKFAEEVLKAKRLEQQPNEAGA